MVAKQKTSGHPPPFRMYLSLVLPFALAFVLYSAAALGGRRKGSTTKAARPVGDRTIVM